MDKRDKRYTGREEEKKRFIIVGCSIIVILVIIAVIAVSHRRRTDALRASEALTRESESAALQDDGTAEETGSEEDTGFRLTEDEGLNQLVRDYFDARLAADTGSIYELFGRSDASPNEAFAEKLAAQASWIQGYQDIKVYSMPGTTENEELCLATYEIDFRRTDAMAPGIMYFYAESDGSGGYTIAETLMKDRVDYAETALSREPAKSLIEETDTALKEALDNDGTLALIYTSFLNGAIYDDTSIDMDGEQDVDIFMDPEDSILVDEDTLKDIAEEASEAASIEAAEAAGDVYETDASDSQSAETAVQPSALSPEQGAVAVGEPSDAQSVNNESQSAADGAAASEGVQEGSGEIESQ